MRKTIVLLLVLACISFTTDTQNKVYICISKSSTAYHLDENCFALKNCNHQIYAVSRSEAINKYGRKLCGHED